MNEMIERVAAALGYDTPLTESEERTAREVIAAMREPTEAMHTAGQEFICDALEQGDVATVTDVWRRMNDEALK